MKIGDTVILIDDIKMFNRIYKKGHIFKICGDSGFRGWDLIDKDNNRIYETLFISDRYILYNIRQERKDKLNKIFKK